MGESQQICGPQADRVPGTNRGHIGDRPGTLIHLQPAPAPKPHRQPLDLVQLALIASPKPQHLSPAGGAAAPCRLLAHFAGMRREGTSPGAITSRRLPLWITCHAHTYAYLLKKQAVWTSRQAVDSQGVSRKCAILVQLRIFGNGRYVKYVCCFVRIPHTIGKT